MYTWPIRNTRYCFVVFSKLLQNTFIYVHSVIVFQDTANVYQQQFLEK